MAMAGYVSTTSRGVEDITTNPSNGMTRVASNRRKESKRKFPNGDSYDPRIPPIFENMLSCVSEFVEDGVLMNLEPNDITKCDTRQDDNWTMGTEPSIPPPVAMISFPRARSEPWCQIGLDKYYQSPGGLPTASRKERSHKQINNPGPKLVETVAVFSCDSEAFEVEREIRPIATLDKELKAHRGAKRSFLGRRTVAKPSKRLKHSRDIWITTSMDETMQRTGCKESLVLASLHVSKQENEVEKLPRKSKWSRFNPFRNRKVTGIMS